MSVFLEDAELHIHSSDKDPPFVLFSSRTPTVSSPQQQTNNNNQVVIRFSGCRREWQQETTRFLSWCRLVVGRCGHYAWAKSNSEANRLACGAKNKMGIDRSQWQWYVLSHDVLCWLLLPLFLITMQLFGSNF